MQAAEDLGIELSGESMRERIQTVCDELGVATGWIPEGTPPPGNLSPADEPEPEPEPELRLELEPEPEEEEEEEEEEYHDEEDEEGEITDSEKLRQLFVKFDEDGDGVLNRREASAFSAAKGAEAVDSETWEQVCKALSCDPAVGMALAEFSQMYSAYGEGNNLRVDYMRICGGLSVTMSAKSSSIRQDVVLLVRVTGSEKSVDGKMLYVVEVSEEEDDYPISTSKYPFKDFQKLRKNLIAANPEIKNLAFPGSKNRTAMLDTWLSSCFRHPDVKGSELYCNFVNISVPVEDVDIDFDGEEAEESRTMKTLSHIYAKVIQGVPGMGSASEMGDQYR